MAALTRLLERNLRNWNSTIPRYLNTQEAATTTADAAKEHDEDEFRVLNLRVAQHTMTRRRVARKEPVLPPRSMRMPTDQDWTAVWPAPRTFHPAAVPLAVRQGYTERGAAPPSKYANAELMKIPNFLHLTPRAIAQQCEALKRFCTPWPQGLEKEVDFQAHFPVEIVHTDYCQALPTIRNPEARRVTLILKLENLKFDAHARDKFLRLVGERYDRDTDTLTIVADRCPLRKQNYDYAMYLLTACYHESFVQEPWEATKSEADMEYYYFERNASKKSAEAIINWGLETGATDGKKLSASSEFAKSVEQLINEGENEYNLQNYKNQVLNMLKIKSTSK